jgi:hypothetical protein
VVFLELSWTHPAATQSRSIPRDIDEMPGFALLGLLIS